MPFLTNKQKLKNEAAALQQRGYIINLQSTQLPGKQHALSIEIIPPKQTKGVIFIIPPNDYAAIITSLNRENLTDFMQQFPNDIAPTFAAGLKEKPPEPSDAIKDYDYLTLR